MFEVDSMIMKLPDNPLSLKKSGLGYGSPSGTLRHYKFILKNSRFVDFKNHAKPSVMFFGRYNEEGIVQNITDEDSSYYET